MAAYPDSYPAPYAEHVLNRPIGAPTPGSLAAPDRLTLQQQANALVFDIERASHILEKLSPTPATEGINNPELPLGTALQVARERLGYLIEKLDGLAMHIGQV